jgi:hypothetical protein
VRFPPDDLSELFLFEQKRRVQADRTVALDGIAYEVDATLVGETVVLRYDPSRPREQHPQNSLRMSDFDGSQGHLADDDKEVF